MDDTTTLNVPGDARTVVLHNTVIAGRPWWVWLLLGLVLLLTLACIALATTVGVLATAAAESETTTVIEVHESGDASAAAKVAIINIAGTISPPFTSTQIDQIVHAREDADVKGVLLRVDSPGGFVADSHQIYHELKKLSAAKPVYVSFGRIAASGGYYVAMGAGPEGKIFAEPTTWTGSIGVIIPRYKAKDLAEKVGVEFEPLVTGPYKDALSPFRDLGEDERAIWDAIIEDSFDRFKGVIEEARPMSEAEVADAATGRIFTAGQALERKLIDETGFEEDAVAALTASLGLDAANVVRYSTPPSLVEILLGANADAPDAAGVAGRVLTPVPHYLYGWPATAVAR